MAGVDIIEKFIGINKIDQNNAQALGKGILSNFGNTLESNNLFLKRVYYRMLPYILSPDKKITLILKDDKTISSALNYLKNDKSLLEYQNAYGDKFGLYYYLKNKPEVIDKTLIYLVKKDLITIQKEPEEMKKELDKFFMDSKDGRFNKEISSFKEAEFEKLIHTIVCALLYLRGKENPKSKPALKDDGSPRFIVKKESQETSSKEQLLKSTEKEFFKLYLEKVISNPEYNKFVKKRIEYKGLDYNMYLGNELKNGNEDLYKKNKLAIINSILEWLGKQPLKELPTGKDFENLLKNLIKDINEKLEQPLLFKKGRKKIAIA